VGIFEIGAPLGRRCVTKVGGDALIATVDGPVLLSRVLPGGRMASGMRVTDKLGRLLADQAALSGSSCGWRFVSVPQGQPAGLKSPSGGEVEQFAVNLRTGAWCRFRGMNSSCWALFNDRPYFGATNGRVVEANTGTRDLDAEVVAEALQAPSYLRRPRVNKQITMVSPLLEAAAAIPLRVGLAANFAPRPQTTADTTIGVAGGVSTPWGSPWGSPWSTPSKTVEAWIGHSARGVAIAPYVRIEQSDKRVAW